MNILALDTSTEACSAALLRDDGAVFAEFELAPRKHMQLLPTMFERLFAAAEINPQALTHCAFCNGPGAFTGIRIAAAQAQGVGLALGIPLLPISTLATLAQSLFDRRDCGKVLVALDARMQEVYWASYVRDDGGCARLDGLERLSDPAAVIWDDDTEFGAGHGWTEVLCDRASFPLMPQLLPHARSLLRLATVSADERRGVDADRVNINYLRNRVAHKAADA